jgi:hypothetical protein
MKYKMKKLLLLPVIVLLVQFRTFAQCGEEAIISTSKTEYLNGQNVLERSVDEASTIEISKTQVVIKPGNADRVMTGTIISQTCDWKTPYAEGLSVIKARFDEPGVQHVTVNIKGEGGKVTVLLEIEEAPDKKIRVNADKFVKK